ncbi:MAG: RNA polymerase sigma factor [Polyangiaceae bacterium]
MRNNTPSSTSPTDRSREEVRDALVTLRPTLYHRALRLTRNREQAEDVVHDTMVRALRFAHQYQAGTNVKAWLNQVLKSVFLTECRRRSRQRRAYNTMRIDPCTWLSKDGLPAMTKLSRGPRRAMDNLPPCYRSAVNLIDLHGMSYRDAAARLGVPLGTVMSRLHRGRKRLAAELLPSPMAA